MARIFKRGGLRVIVADSLSPTLCDYSAAVDRAYTVAAPAHDLRAFERDLQVIIATEKVDLLIPMCEEALYISMILDRLLTRVLTMPFEQIEELHNKWSFIQLLNRYGLKAPETHLVRTREEAAALPRSSQKMILKKVYSRFGASLHLILPGEVFPSVPFDPVNPYVAQVFIEGVRLCTYSVAINGKLTAHSEYQVLQSMGMGSGITFRSILTPDVFAFVRTFVERYGYTGQISFDFIQGEDGVYCIECNPRATSGLHLFDKSPALIASFLTGQTPCLFPQRGTVYRDLLFSLWFGIKQGEIFQPEFWRRLFKGKTPFYDRYDKKPLFCIPRLLIDVMKKTLFQGKGFHEVMSRDVEYNGRKL